MKNPRISLIIPAYNEERHLAACLDSVAAQITKPYEVIVVDNNSNDATAKVARRYTFVTVVKEPRQGRIYAQAKGFEVATGEVLARTDADTVLPPDWVALVQKHIAGTDGLTGREYFSGMLLRGLVSICQAGFVQYLQRVLAGTYCMYGANMALRAECWPLVRDAVLQFPHLDEDVIASLLLKRRSKRIAYVPNLTVETTLFRGKRNMIDMISHWPQDYWAVGLYGRGIVMCILTILLLIVLVPTVGLAHFLASAFHVSSHP